MERIDVAKLLKDCPSGMKLDSTMYENIVFDKIIEDDKNFPIRVIRSEDGLRMSLTKYGQYSDIGSAKCIIFPEGKNTWKGFHRPFKDGDVVYVCDEYSDATFNYVAILKQIEKGGQIYSHCFYNYEDAEFGINSFLYDSYNIRFATEEEKEKLFKVIKDNGYEWNPETKTLEKLVEPKFKSGDVIVCENHWGPFISIFKENITERNGFIGHCVLDVDDNEFKVKDSASYFNKVRLATKREKEQLFRAIQNNGYKWNEETKTLEKLQRKFDITTLKTFDKVLVRDTKEQVWVADLFSHIVNSSLVGYKFACIGHYTNQCIPYEGNEHLLGTADDCDEYFNLIS